jgi:4-amino-4-deoxy-L-arabinose transferase-like glycosyltransferase
VAWGQASGPTHQRGGGALGDETGQPGLLRLFNRQLAGQIGWLLPLAAIGLVTAAWQTRLQWPITQRHQSLLLWAAWLVPMLVFFSVASFFHRYYLEMMAPAIAALAGAGLVALWTDYRRSGWRGWLLPIALVSTVAVEAIILSDFPEWSRWLTPLVMGLCLLAATVLTLVRLVSPPGQRRWVRIAAGVGVTTLLFPMLIWAAIPVWHGGHSGLPYAGPDLLEEPHHNSTTVERTRLTDYLLANQGDATYLAATLRANDAAPLILAIGEPVMALGGFSGSDQILTPQELRDQVADGTVRFFLLSPDSGRQTPLVRWITQACTAVPDSQWRDTAAGRGGRQRLFDCGTLAASAVQSTGGTHE